MNKINVNKKYGMAEVKAMGLTEDEFRKANEILGREPNWTELGMIAAMWSEHCSYKSSRVHLGRFPTTGKRVLEGPGENAGVVDIGEGLACVFKIESHNHPSYIEPYQGAATGVGGIMRDVFTMGARPIANLNSLRFGSPEHPKTTHLISGVVAGIGDYGNCMGVPTVGGEMSFHNCYNGNILVNAFTLGIVPSKKYFKASASGVGNPIFYVGSRTGRDGIHGATMASEAFNTADKKAEEKRPTVQVGDPFTEKLLLEACLELMESDAIVGIQDMGAAGLTSSSFEMAGRAGTGIKLNLDRIPCREEAMTPYEMMLSESQERMLLTAKRGSENAIKEIFEKWGLEVSQVGEVTNDGHVTLVFQDEIVARLPALPLSTQAPKYQRPLREPTDFKKNSQYHVEFPSEKDMASALKMLLASPHFCSRHWVFEQYDSSVRTNTVQSSGGDAAVLRLKESTSGKGLAMSSDVNPRYVRLHPYLGGAHAIAEACRNLSCVGAEPIGLTDCMNFGNPENPEVMWQFSQAVDGMSEACRQLGVPIVSGNVSFYNETNGQDIYPTPTVVAVGLLENVERTVGIGFKEEGDRLVLLGDLKGQLEASEYLAYFYDMDAGMPAAIDWNLEKNVSRVCREAIQQGLLNSAHDLSDGGLLIALVESALASKDHALGAAIDLKNVDLRPDQLWFGEGPSRILVSLPEKNLKKLEALSQKAQIGLHHLGQVSPKKLTFTDAVKTHTVELNDVYDQWRFALDRYMQGKPFSKLLKREKA